MTKKTDQLRVDRRFHSQFRIALIAVLVVFLPACSTLEIAYRMADRLALRYVAGYTKLTNRQKGLLSPRFEARMQDHEQRELPQYVALFRDARIYSADQLTREEVDQLLDELKRLYALLIEESIPLAVATLQLLDDEQLMFLQRRLEKNVNKDQEDVARDPQARQAQRAGNVVEDIEDWTGKLDENQVALVATHLAGMSDNEEDWSRFRHDRNRRLLQTLRTRQSKQSLAQVIRDGWVTFDMADEQLRENWASNRNLYREMLVDLDATLTERQRQKMVKRFSKYETNLANLLPDDAAADRVALINQ